MIKLTLLMETAVSGLSAKKAVELLGIANIRTLIYRRGKIE